MALVTALVPRGDDRDGEADGRGIAARRSTLDRSGSRLTSAFEAKLSRPPVVWTARRGASQRVSGSALGVASGSAVASG